MYNDLKLKLLNGAFALAGNFISGQIKGESEDKHSQNLDNYYNKLSSLVEKKQKQPIPAIEQKTEPESKPTIPTPTIDLTPKKIEAGTACIICSRDHFSTTSAALGEALRFGRKEGINHVEVQRRLGLALDELNIMERIDLAPESIAGLIGKEKEIAVDALNNSRELRHQITAIHSPDDLEKTAAYAANIRTKFMKDIFSIAMNDGTVDKLCKNLSGKEKVKCIDTINKVLQKEM